MRTTPDLSPNGRPAGAAHTAALSLSHRGPHYAAGLPKLQKILLFKNRIGDSGVRSLAQAVQSGALTELKVRRG